MTYLFRDLHGPRRSERGSIICIGAFDGVHLGHQHLLGQVRARAQALDCNAIAVSFEPLPRAFFNASIAFPRISTARQKFEAMRAAGMASVGLLRFNAALANTSAEDFVQRLLVARLNVREVWVGPGFRFGKGRTGDLELLQCLGRVHGFTAHTVNAAEFGGERISSTRIRSALAEGDLTLAKSMLGHDFVIDGKVVHGLKLGRTLGYPTANLPMGSRVPPLRGIHAVLVSGAGLNNWPSVASLGTRPTIAGREPLLEAHLFDFNGDLYGQRLSVAFVQKLRDEIRFDNLDALVVQMHADASQARAVLAQATAVGVAQT